MTTAGLARIIFTTPIKAIAQRRAFSSAAKTLEFIKNERVGTKNNIALITLNRPKQLNALNSGLINEVSRVVKELDNDSSVSVVVITGSEKAFAAGADIKEMQKKTYAEVITDDFLSGLDAVANTRKPVIAAVNGYALGGGCELAMMCDIIYAGNKARFGQPEITIGTIPGAGGTQRLTRAVGKSKAMELCLTGNQITAEEAQQMGLVSRVFAPEQLLPETLKLAEKIASQSLVTTVLCKAAVKSALETTLNEGLNFERKIFNSTFATADQKEGMTAFVEKRAPAFKNE